MEQRLYSWKDLPSEGAKKKKENNNKSASGTQRTDRYLMTSKDITPLIIQQDNSNSRFLLEPLLFLLRIMLDVGKRVENSDGTTLQVV